MKFLSRRRSLVTAGGLIALLATVPISFAKKPGGGGENGGGGGGGFSGLIYVRDTDLDQTLEVTSSETTIVANANRMEPSHATHGGSRWFLRQKRLGSNDYILELYDEANNAIQIAPLAGITVDPRSDRHRPRWVASVDPSGGVVEDSAISYFGLDFSTTPPTGGLYRLAIEWVVGVPQPVEPINHILVTGLDVRFNEENQKQYEVEANGLDWNRDGTQYVMGKIFLDGNGERRWGLWLGDILGSTALHRDGGNTIVEGIRPEWSRGGNPTVDGVEIETIAFQCGPDGKTGICTIGEDGFNETLVAETYRRKKDEWHHLRNPHWSPDGSELIYDDQWLVKGSFIQRSTVYRVARNGGSPVPVISDTEYLRGVGWRSP